LIGRTNLTISCVECLIGDFQRCKVFHFGLVLFYWEKFLKAKIKVISYTFSLSSCKFLAIISFFFHFVYLVPTYLLKNKQKQCKCQCSDHKHKKGINTHTFADDLWPRGACQEKKEDDDDDIDNIADIH